MKEVAMVCAPILTVRRVGSVPVTADKLSARWVRSLFRTQSASDGDQPAHGVGMCSLMTISEHFAWVPGL